MASNKCNNLIYCNSYYTPNLKHTLNKKFINRWWCHVDDDTYLNVPKLIKLLNKYNFKESVILGKTPHNHPVKRKVNMVCIYMKKYINLKHAVMYHKHDTINKKFISEISCSCSFIQMIKMVA